MEANFEVILLDKKMTDFMQAADVFQNSKVIWKISNITIQYKDKVSFNQINKIMPTIVEAYKKTWQTIIFLHLKDISNETTIEINKNKVPPYIKKDVKIISNWDTWLNLLEYIKQKYGLLEEQCIK